MVRYYMLRTTTTAVAEKRPKIRRLGPAVSGIPLKRKAVYPGEILENRLLV